MKNEKRKLFKFLNFTVLQKHNGNRSDMISELGKWDLNKEAGLFWHISFPGKDIIRNSSTWHMNTSISQNQNNINAALKYIILTYYFNINLNKIYVKDKVL